MQIAVRLESEIKMYCFYKLDGCRFMIVLPSMCPRPSSNLRFTSNQNAWYSESSLQ